MTWSLRVQTVDVCHVTSRVTSTTTAVTTVTNWCHAVGPIVLHSFNRNTVVHLQPLGRNETMTMSPQVDVFHGLDRTQSLQCGFDDGWLCGYAVPADYNPLSWDVTGSYPDGTYSY